ncbi:MAG: precorrin-2 C(20)-methyltransferase [Firmicutes bacterium]|nr:precorrin-2 C(20)-methyltransferase [Bacillota bacterium]
MKGRLYGIGVGPGDPELMTIKAKKTIEASDIVVVPGENVEDSIAYRIAKGACENLDALNLVALEMPMIKEKKKLGEMHDKAAQKIETWLDEGKIVSFLTLGDVTVYSTYMYVHQRVVRDGYDAAIVNGITSFTAAAARLNTDLVERAEPLHVIPATFKVDGMAELLSLPGTKVLMKSGKEIGKVREAILASGQKAMMVENCGMDNEKIYLAAEDIPDTASYYSLIIVKEPQEEAE